MTRLETVMALRTLSIEARMDTNECAPITGPMDSEEGLIEVQRDDENSVSIHFRHWADVQAFISAQTTRVGAVALAHALLDAANDD